MRMTVEDLIDELKKMPPKVPVSFRTGQGDSERNHIARVDNFGHKVVVVVEHGV